MFHMTNNSKLLCSDKNKVDSNGKLNVYALSTNSWLNVPDNWFSNEQINTATNSVVGAVGALATLANFYQSLPLTLAVSAGVIVGAGLLLAFQLKEDRFDVKLPLIKRSPVSGEYFKQLELKYDGTLQIDSSSK